VQFFGRCWTSTTIEKRQFPSDVCVCVCIGGILVQCLRIAHMITASCAASKTGQISPG
jgi:hypothetical protein